MTPDRGVRDGVVDPRVEQLLLELLHREPDAAPVFKAWKKDKKLFDQFKDISVIRTASELETRAVFQLDTCL